MLTFLHKAYQNTKKINPFISSKYKHGHLERGGKGPIIPFFRHSYSAKTENL